MFDLCKCISYEKWEIFGIVCVLIVVTLIVCGVGFVSVLFWQVLDVGGLSVGVGVMANVSSVDFCLFSKVG